VRDKCANCYFGDKCRTYGGCDDYAPLELTDEDVAEEDERRRAAFEAGWLRYATEYSDST